MQIEIKILIVDDDVFNLLILEQFISKNQTHTFKVIKANNGRDAVE